MVLSADNSSDATVLMITKLPLNETTLYIRWLNAKELKINLSKTKKYYNFNQPTVIPSLEYAKKQKVYNIK